MTKKLFLAVLLATSLATSAFGQTHRAEIGGGYSFLRDQDVGLNFHGWVGSVTGNYNRWFGLEGEVGGNYKTTQVLGTDINLSVHSFAGGPRFTAKMLEGSDLAPFAHVLIGAGHTSASLLGRRMGPPATNATNTILQPGAGINYWFRPDVAVRFGGDYRRIFDERAGANEFRFHIGIVLGLGTF